MSFTGIYFIICNAQHNKSHYKGEKEKKSNEKLFSFLCIQKRKYNFHYERKREREQQKHNGISKKQKLSIDFFPHKKSLKRNKIIKFQPDSLSEEAFVTISHVDIHKSHYVVIRREPLKTHSNSVCRVQYKLCFYMLYVFDHPIPWISK